MQLNNFLFILASVSFNAAAQIFLKKGLSRFGNLASLANVWIISGLACFLFSLGLWLYAISKVNVSIAYPFNALGYIITAIAAFWFLGEPLSCQKIMGIIVICIGVAILFFSETR